MLAREILVEDMNKKPEFKKTFLYRLKYSLTHLGGLNGRKLSTGATLYIFALFIQDNQIKIVTDSELLSQVLSYWHFCLLQVVAPSVYALGAFFMVAGALHKIYKFLFPRALLGI